MKTAVEYLIDWMGKNQYFIGNDLLQAVDQAKEMEKEQIKDAHIEGFYSPPFRKSRNGEAEEYYNEKFKTK